MKKNKKLLIKIIIGLVLVAAVCTAGYFLLIRNNSNAASGNALIVRETHLLNTQPNWLIGKRTEIANKKEVVSYYHLADVAAPEGFVQVYDAADTDDDSLTTFFCYDGQTADGKDVRLTIALVPQDHVQPAVHEGQTLVCYTPSLINELMIEIRAVLSAPVDADAGQALLDSFLPCITPVYDSRTFTAKNNKIPTAKETTLTAIANVENKSYYKLGEVTDIPGFTAVTNVKDTDDDPLTSLFCYDGKDARGQDVRVIITAGTPDSAKLAENILIFRRLSPVKDVFIEIWILSDLPMDVETARALEKTVASCISPTVDKMKLELKEREIADAASNWLITKKNDAYFKLGELAEINKTEFTTTKKLTDTDNDPLTTFFGYTGRNDLEGRTYLIYPQAEPLPDIGDCAAQGWGDVTLGNRKAFLYPENMDAENATAVFCRIDSPYDDIDIEIKATLTAPASLQDWLEICRFMSDLITVSTRKLSPIEADFKLNFIDDNRWKDLLSGLGVTMQITFFATLLGIVIGVLIAVVRSTWDKAGENMRPGIGKFLLKILNAFCKFYLTIIRGTPVVIQLMLAYYVILTNTHSGVLVAILSFGINSGAYVAEIIRAGIQSVDNGQFEAGRSLGFNYVSTMWHIIVPQAFKNVLPSLANEFIVLLKETSIAGYVAVRDLTKEGDLIRGTTFSAFMPLIAVAIIYLVIVMFFTWLVGKLERRLRNSDH